MSSLHRKTLLYKVDQILVVLLQAVQTRPEKDHVKEASEAEDTELVEQKTLSRRIVKQKTLIRRLVKH